MRLQSLTRSSLAVVALGLSLFSAAPAQASEQFTFVNGGSIVAFGFYVGRYNGLRGTSPGAPVILNCVDFFHEVRNGDTWNANVSSLGSGLGIGSNTRSTSLEAYREAAWLTTQYATHASETANIQATIWGLFPGTPALPSNVVTTNGSFWRDAAIAAQPSFDANGFYVVTDVNKANAASIQEFNIRDVTSTPEPGTLVLLSTGIMGLSAARFRRKKPDSPH